MPIQHNYPVGQERKPMNLKDKVCLNCQEEFTPLSGAQKLCDPCRKVVEFEKKNGGPILEDIHTGSTIEEVDEPIAIKEDPIITKPAPKSIAVIRDSSLDSIAIAALHLVNLCTERGCEIDLEMNVGGVIITMKKETRA